MKKIIALVFAAAFCASLFAAQRKVVLIGIDGWKGKNLDAYEMPNVKRAMKEGSFTARKRSVLPSSSAPNWTSIITGCCVELHGHTQWGSKTPEIPSRAYSKYGKCPGIFGVLRGEFPNIKTACFYDWEVIGDLIEAKAADKVQFLKLSSGGENVVNAAVEYMRAEKPDFIFIYMDEPDHTGHKFGFDSPEYMAQVKLLDVSIGKIFQAVKDNGDCENTVFIIVSDHGGLDKKHGGITLDEMEAPFIAFGKGIRKNFEITDSVMSFDVAPTIAHIMGVKKVPQVWVGRAVSQMFQPKAPWKKPARKTR